MPASEEFDATLTYLAVLAGRLNPSDNQDVRRLVHELVTSRRQITFRRRAAWAFGAKGQASLT